MTSYSMYIIVKGVLSAVSSFGKNALWEQTLALSTSASPGPILCCTLTNIHLSNVEWITERGSEPAKLQAVEETRSWTQERKDSAQSPCLASKSHWSSKAPILFELQLPLQELPPGFPSCEGWVWNAVCWCGPCLVFCARQGLTSLGRMQRDVFMWPIHAYPFVCHSPI